MPRPVVRFSPAKPIPFVQMEQFALNLADGLSVREAYEKAGYVYNNPNSSRLKKRVWPRVEFLLERRSRADEQANALVVGKLALQKEVLARELAKSAQANILDYTRVEGDVLVADFSRLTRDQAAAVREVKLVTRTHGRGESAVVERTMHFKLYSRNEAIMDIARLLGYIDKDNRGSFEERMAAMKPEERRAHASGLLRQVRQRLIEYNATKEPDDVPVAPAEAPTIEGSATEISTQGVLDPRVETSKEANGEPIGGAGGLGGIGEG